MDRRKLFKNLGYGAFAVAALLVSFYLTFPAQAVAQRLAGELRAKSKGQLSFAFQDVSLYRFSGIEAEGVTVTMQREADKPLEIEVDELRARLRLLPLLLLRLSVHAEVELGEGTLSANVTLRGDDVDVGLDVDGLDFAAPPILPRLAGVAFGGKLEAEGNTFWAHKPEASTGGLTLKLENASFGPGSVSGFTVPSLGLGTLAATLELKEGKLKVAKWEQQGGQVSVTLAGDLGMRPTLAQSTMDLCVQLKVVDQQFLEKNDKVKTALQFAEVRFQKDPRGFLNLPLRGTIAHPQAGRGLCRKAS
jgi:type II secretion system protein N